MVPHDDGAAAPGQPAQPRMEVLVIDPDVAAAKALAAELIGFSMVTAAPTARAASGVLATRSPSMIVTELDLPDASGLDLIARIHAAPATRHILLMVVTRRGTVSDKIAAFKAGADDYLVKPATPQDIALHVRMLSRFRQVYYH